jgi:hypothetical protein
MFRLLNIIPPLAIVLGVYMAYRRNLFEIGLLVGRSFFGLILALALFGPVRGYAASLVDFPLAYGNAASYFCIWFAVMLGFDTVVVRMLKVKSEKMKFQYQTPGILVGGALVGLLMSMGLTAGGVLVPEIEGGFMEAEADPAARLPTRAESLYSAATLTSPGTLSNARMEAGHHWASRQIQKYIENGRMGPTGACLRRFDDRYTRMRVDPEKLKRTLRDLSEMVPEPAS